MNPFLIAVLIGLAAGTIDVFPMLLMKLDKTACISAFLHYLVLGMLIPFVNWDLAPAVKGILISMLSALPVLALQLPKDKKSAVPIVLFSIALGAAIGWAGSRFII